MSDAKSTDGALFRELDRLACAVLKNPAYDGNRGNWFLGFRRGMDGVFHRWWSAEHHYLRLMAWFPVVLRRHHECDLASCLFGMDSALECWAYTLNTLGWAIAPADFLSFEDGKDLKRISPYNIIGPKPVPGYATLYPSVTKAWCEKAAEIRLIMENHDVSKHRSATFWGGTHDMDLPPHVKAAGITAQSPGFLFIAPMKSVQLLRDPKVPLSKLPHDRSEWCELKDLKLAFDEVMALTLKAAIEDIVARTKT